MATVRQNQIVAVEKGLRGRAKKAITEIHRALGKPALFSGLSRVYTPNDADAYVHPAEHSEPQLNVRTQLESAASHFSDLLDAMATKDFGNTTVCADVTVDGSVLIEKAPVPFLLALEKELIDWRTLVSEIPVLDASEVWEYDENSSQYRTQPVGTVKTENIIKPFVLYPATPEHPAQVDKLSVATPIGTWKTTKFSNAVTRGRRDDLVDAVNKLIDAVKIAREEANSMEVEQKKIAERLFEFLLP